MVSDTTEAFATRIRVDRAEVVYQAIEQTELSQSDLLGRALRYYIDQNPDQIEAFQSATGEQDVLAKAGILDPES